MGELFLINKSTTGKSLLYIILIFWHFCIIFLVFVFFFFPGILPKFGTLDFVLCADFNHFNLLILMF